MRKNNFLYINEFDNICLLTSFAVIIIYNIMLFIIKEGIIKIPSGYSDAVTVASIILPYIVSTMSFLIKRNMSKLHTNNKIFEPEERTMENSYFAGIFGNNRQDIFDKDYILKRSGHINKIYNKIIDDFNRNNRCLMITGESGAGKSTLLCLLKKKLENEKIDVEIINKNYNSLVLNNDDKKKKVFCLDQFELALDYTEYIEVVQKALQNKNNYLIFIFPQDYFAMVTSALKFVKYDIYPLCIDDEDFKKLKEQIKSFCDLEEEKFSEYYKHNERTEDKRIIILCDTLKQLEQNKIPLIEFELQGKILENGYSDFIITDDEMNSYALDVYLNQWIEKFPHKETAYQILYLLSDNNSYDITDLQIVTFADKQCFNLKGKCSEQGLNIIDAINDNLLIDSLSRNGTIYFRFKHGYISEQVLNYCQRGNFEPEIIKNVDYYRHILKEEKKEIHSEYLDEIKKRYKRYTNIQSKIPLWITISILLVVIGLINWFMPKKSNSDIHITYIFISIICAPAMYYIYNYCCRMLRMFSFGQYACIALFGSATVILAYVCYDCWAIFMGAEIIILSINIFFLLRNKTFNAAKEKYTKDAGIFTIIGLVIIGLGILFCAVYKEIISNGTLSLAWNNVYWWLIVSYYMLFVIYALLSIVSHINYKYVLIHIGYANMSSQKLKNK